MDGKQCPDCGLHKPPDAYRRNTSLADGLSFYCRECFALRDKASYARRRAAAGSPVRARREVLEGKKFCPACDTVLSVDEFHRSSTQSGGRASWCKRCKGVADEQRRLRRLYGLDTRSLGALREAQEGLCAVCRQGPAEHVDHDHVTGSVRGLLCFRCNVGLGNFQDDAERLRAAAEYVAQHSWQHVEVDVGVYRMVPPRGAPVA